jgi:uncharacterized protein YceK
MKIKNILLSLLCVTVLSGCVTDITYVEDDRVPACSGDTVIIYEHDYHPYYREHYEHHRFHEHRCW